MSNLQVLDIMYQAFQLALRLSMPFLLVSMAVGVLIAISRPPPRLMSRP